MPLKGEASQHEALVVLNLIPGECRLQASKIGFETSKQSPFTLLVNRPGRSQKAK
jgi:hypothetical protein